MVENVAQNVAAEHVNAVNVQNVEVNLANAKNSIYSKRSNKIRPVNRWPYFILCCLHQFNYLIIIHLRKIFIKNTDSSKIHRRIKIYNFVG